MNAKQREFLKQVLENAIGEMNAQALRGGTGLDPNTDDIRQRLCDAYGLVTGKIIGGNLARSVETQRAIKKYGRIK